MTCIHVVDRKRLTSLAWLFVGWMRDFADGDGDGVCLSAVIIIACMLVESVLASLAARVVECSTYPP